MAPALKALLGLIWLVLLLALAFGLLSPIADGVHTVLYHLTSGQDGAVR